MNEEIERLADRLVEQAERSGIRMSRETALNIAKIQIEEQAPNRKEKV